MMREMFRSQGRASLTRRTGVLPRPRRVEDLAAKMKPLAGSGRSTLRDRLAQLIRLQLQERTRYSRAGMTADGIAVHQGRALVTINDMVESTRYNLRAPSSRRFHHPRSCGIPFLLQDFSAFAALWGKANLELYNMLESDSTIQLHALLAHQQLEHSSRLPRLGPARL